jgi:plasmid stabilization system protein ParE
VNREVFVSKKAERQLVNLFNYLEENWSESVKKDFIIKLDKRIDIIKNQPEAFPVSTIKSQVYKCVITKQTTLYYKFDQNRIYIITIFDTRQNPNKIKGELK